MDELFLCPASRCPVLFIVVIFPLEINVARLNLSPSPPFLCGNESFKLIHNNLVVHRKTWNYDIVTEIIKLYGPDACSLCVSMRCGSFHLVLASSRFCRLFC